MSSEQHYLDYDQIRRLLPLGARIADALVNSTYESYNITDGGAHAAPLRASLQSMGFGTQLRQIVEDTVVYGDSYWEITNFRPFAWQRIDPLQVDNFRVEPTTRPGGQAYRLTLEAIAIGGREILPENCVHFTRHAGSGGPFGMSAYGGWFGAFQSIQEASRVISQGGDGDAQGFLADAENRALMGADGMPDVVATRNLSRYSLPLRVNRNSPFALAVQDRQRELQDQIERELFPHILNANWTNTGWPKITIRGNLILA